MRSKPKGSWRFVCSKCNEPLTSLQETLEELIRKNQELKRVIRKKNCIIKKLKKRRARLR